MSEIGRFERIESIDIDEATRSITDWALNNYSDAIDRISQAVATGHTIERGGLSGRKILAVVDTFDVENVELVRSSIELMIGSVAKDAYSRGLAAGIEAMK